jgi:phage gpG-like protein
MSAQVTVDKLAQVLASMAELVKRDVLVGIPDSAPERKEQTPLSNAQIGYIQEFGSPAANIPARPFLIPGVENARPEVLDSLRAGTKAALDGNTGQVEKSMARAGIQAQNAVRAKIQDGPFVPLSPKTLAARRKRGRTGDKPLLDTAQLRNSVTFVIRKK